jgi:hydroxylamine reductase
MFCNQCEQTSKGFACSSIGVCGKSAEAAELQDALLYALKGLCTFTSQA